MYLYNPKRHTLHIRNYCYYATGHCPDYIVFDSEDEAMAYDGRSVGMCKLCQKKREEIMKEKKEV